MVTAINPARLLVLKQLPPTGTGRIRERVRNGLLSPEHAKSLLQEDPTVSTRILNWLSRPETQARYDAAKALRDKEFQASRVANPKPVAAVPEVAPKGKKGRK